MEHISPHSVRKLLSAFRLLDQSSGEDFTVRKDLPPKWGSGFTERVGIQPGLELIMTHYRLSHGLSLHLQVDQPMLSFGCVIKGRTSIGGPSFNTGALMYDGGGINLWASERYYSFTAARCNYCSLSLEVSQSFLAKTILNAGIKPTNILSEAVSRPSFPLYLNCEPISAIARSAALSLLSSSSEDPLQGLLLESHALTILREQLLSLFPRKKGPPSFQTIHSRTLEEQLEEARRLLERSPQSSPKLSDLAALTGLNEWSLKKGFRTRFGVTVYDYLRAHRMKTADAMLCTVDFNVSETATAVDYKNPVRFATAYRREFGLPPKARQIRSSNQFLSSIEAIDVSV